MSRRLVIFDVDGTLVDSQAHIVASIEAACTAAGVALPDRAFALAGVGLSLALFLRRLAPDAPDGTHARMAEAYKDAFQSIRTSGDAASPLFPGTRQMLDRLAGRDDLVLGIATGKSRRGLDHVLEQHGLGDYFFTRQVADDHPSKPHPSMIEAALRETGVSVREAVMVGDTEYDIEMGHTAGVRTVGVTWGYHERERLKPHVLIDGWSAFDGVLEGLWATA